ncbi:MAG TPA: hypothetical protein VF070_38070 [Streptosporangiaceae bacterium]
MSELGTLLGRPRRRRGKFFAAGIILLATGATLSSAVHADAATEPSVGVEWFVTPGGDAGQCGNPTSASQFAVSPDWTSPIRIDTDSRAGGCELSFGIFDPSSLLTGGVSYTWGVSPGGDGNQCKNQGTFAMPVNRQFESFGSIITDDTDNRPGWCNLTFTVSNGSNIGLDVQFFADPSGSDGQCVNALPQGSFETAAAGAPVTIMTDTDDRPGGCWLSVRLRHFPSAAAAQHAAGIHRA